MANSIDRDLARALDPVIFARDCGVQVYPWQAEALRSTNLREAWVCSRQSGKSTCAALLATHRLVFGAPGSTVVAISVGQRQASELVAKSKAFYRMLGQPLGATSDREGSLTVENGSRLVSLPGGGEGGAALRGLSAQLLLVDEASRVPDATWTAIRPFLAVGAGRAIALSTPWSEQGWYASAALGRDPGWVVRRVHAEEVLDPAFLAAERASMLPGDWDREYGISFTAVAGSIWNPAHWAALEDWGAPTLSNFGAKDPLPTRRMTVIDTYGEREEEKRL